MIEKMAHALTRKPKLVVMIAALSLIPSILATMAVRVNYDILSYLPEDLPSVQGERLLEEPFEMAATTMLVVENMPPEYTHQLQQEIEDVPGVSSATWLSSIVGIQFPKEMLPEDIRDVFFSDDATMMIIQYEHPGGSAITMDAIEEIRGLCNKNCFLAGVSAFTKDLKDAIVGEMPLYMLVAVLLSMVAMNVMMESWLLPAALLMSIGLAIIYNSGTNILLGEISYITQSIAAVLQLGVTMDYSIFLYDRYMEELPRYEDKRDAMAVSVVAAFKSIFGSSLTTIAGFLALCVMRLTLGRDIGLVMAKGVLLGILTVVLILPSILLLMDRAILKYRHRAFRPDMSKINAFVVRHRKGLAALFLILFIPAIYSDNHKQLYYDLTEGLPADTLSTVATKELKEKFDMASSHFIIVDDSLSHGQMNALTDELEELDGITSVASYDKFLPDAIPDFFLPSDLKDMFKQGGYQLVMVNSAYESSSDEVEAQIEEMQAVLDRYDPNAYVTGEAAMSTDLVATTAVDFEVTNYLSIAAIFILLIITFKSISIPVLLVAAIELAIFINQGLAYFAGASIAFVTPTIIGCIQLGATVDYAILMTSRFQEELQKGKDRFQAIQDAANSADVSILTSGLVFFSATLGVSLVSSMDLIRGMCGMLSRGAIISSMICIFILPAILVTFEPLINKTTLHWRVPKPPKQERPGLPEGKKGVPAGKGSGFFQLPRKKTADSAKERSTISK